MHTVSKHTPSLHVNKTAHAHDKTGIGTCQNKSLTVTSNASNTRCFLASKFSNRYGAKNAPEGRILYLNIRIISGGRETRTPAAGSPPYSLPTPCPRLMLVSLV